MRSPFVLTAALLLACCLAFSQGTNAANNQQISKPRTGRAGEIITSPDMNSAVTGTRGNTLGTPGDISSRGDPAVAGSGSPGAESTAAVSTREQMERESLRAREGQSSAKAAAKPSQKKGPGLHGKHRTASSVGNTARPAKRKDGLQP